MSLQRTNKLVKKVQQIERSTRRKKKSVWRELLKQKQRQVLGKMKQLKGAKLNQKELQEGFKSATLLAKAEYKDRKEIADAIRDRQKLNGIKIRQERQDLKHKREFVKAFEQVIRSNKDFTALKTTADKFKEDIKETLTMYAEAEKKENATETPITPSTTTSTAPQQPLTTSQKPPPRKPLSQTLSTDEAKKRAAQQRQIQKTAQLAKLTTQQRQDEELLTPSQISSIFTKPSKGKREEGIEGSESEPKSKFSRKTIERMEVDQPGGQTLGEAKNQ